MLPPLADCIAALRPAVTGALRSEGVRLDTFDRLTRDVQDLRPTIDSATRTQPEFVLPIWDYITRRVDAQRVDEGKAVLAEQQQALRGIETRHGVDPATAVAVFGIETDYGKVSGRHRVIDATLSRSCLRPESAERRRQFFAALWLVQEGIVPAEEFRGSWAGAFGMTQFMPATFRAYMDDADGSGRPDIFHSVPDALGTTARYLNGLRWQRGLPWGVEVRAPAALVAASGAAENEHACVASAQGGGKCRALAAWAAAGVVRVDGETFGALSARWPEVDAHTRFALLAPAGAAGPAWLVSSNYRALWQYNRADAYALAIGLLADRLRGDAPMQGRWPTDDGGLSRAEFRELQSLLRERGACDVTVDGREGPRSTAAIVALEREAGWVESGRAGQRVLERVRSLSKAVPSGASAPEAAASEGGAACPRD